MPELDEAAKPAKADFNAFSAEEITFAFDTVFIVRKARADIDLNPLRAYLDSIGDISAPGSCPWSGPAPRSPPGRPR